MISSSNPPKTPSMPQSSKTNQTYCGVCGTPKPAGEYCKYERWSLDKNQWDGSVTEIDVADTNVTSEAQNQPQSDIRSDLWELFKQVPTPSKGNGTINDFFDLLVPYITNHTKAATIELEEELKAAKDNLK